jgi:hypothetical protein
MSRFLVVGANALGVAAILGTLWFPTADMTTRVFVSICAVALGFNAVFSHHTSETYLAWYREALDRM